jgi:hypothetical protein
MAGRPPEPSGLTGLQRVGHPAAEGALDADALQGALTALGQRHEALRCCFGADGSEQFVLRDAGLSLQRVDLTRQPQDSREAALRLAAEQAVETVFDLERGPLLRATCTNWRPMTTHCC